MESACSGLTAAAVIEAQGGSVYSIEQICVCPFNYRSSLHTY